MKRYLSISEMAQIHNISRQTLIYYDKIHLFKPSEVDEHGYRHYSSDQIPLLREICFLKKAGIKLEVIKDHIDHRNIKSAISLLEFHENFINQELQKLLITRVFIENRLNLYRKAYRFQDELNHPVIEEFPERKVIFLPYENNVTKDQLHFTMMKAWNLLMKHNVLPSSGFGTIIKASNIDIDNIRCSDVLKDAGVYVTLPVSTLDIGNVKVLPAGQYMCMYKYAMPYETEYLFSLLEWIKDNKFRIVGDIVDACLLDTTFYNEQNSVDFCELQIPVEPII